MAATYDLILKDGTVVNHDGKGVRDLGVRGGRIAAVGDLGQASAAETIASRSELVERRSNNLHPQCRSADKGLQALIAADCPGATGSPSLALVRSAKDGLSVAPNRQIRRPDRSPARARTNSGRLRYE